VDETAQHSRDSPRACIARAPHGFTVTGTKRYVADGPAADLLLVSVTTEEGAVMALVRADAPGVTVQAVTSIDSRGMADIRFDAAPVEALLTEVHGRNPVGFALDCACIGLAAEMLGASSRAFEMTLDYMRTRRQFGQPIGGFQALQHRAARL
jgi:alkylation response protein AidB-like acyl-CoA dehydrogenase